jgi:hypothetical protein
MPSHLRPHHAFIALAFALLAVALQAQTAASPASTPAGAVALLQPLGLAYDAQGDLFFAEAGNHTIRRLDPAGNLTTVAGSGTQGFSGDGGAAIAAQLDSPHAVVLDSAGNLFIADTHNHRVRRVDAITQTISSVAGTGSAGFSGEFGPATSARLASPLGLALDATNHLYIADSGNHRIRRLDLETGLITTVAGTGAQGFSGDRALAISASVDTPSGLAVDSFGNLYLADTDNHRIRRVDALTHLITTVAGGTPTSPLAHPVAIAITTAGLLIADPARHRILQLDLSSGALSTVAGQGTQTFAGDGGLATAAMLDSPAALAITPSGDITVADTGNGRIRQVAANGSITTVAGLGTLLAGSLTLSGATTQSYGSTTLVAALATATEGTVSLLDSSSGSSTLLSQTTLTGGLARFILPSLSAGPHHLLATFAGTSTHRAAQSQTLAVTISPLPLSATITGPSAVLFGQPLPSLGAALTGALSSDTSNLALAVTTDAISTSVPGTYAIHCALSGPAALNYTFNPPVASLTIAKAPAILTLTQLGGILAARVASSTSGTPTGSVTLLTSAGTRLTTVLLSPAASADLSSATLPDGVYSLTALYSGDADFLSAQSPTLNLTIGTPAIPSDFTFGPPSNTAQTVNAGSTAQFAFAIKPTGSTSLAGPVTLSASALPVGFSANFDPPVIPPGGAVTSFTLSVVTPRALAINRPAATPRRTTCLTLACLAPLLVFGLSRHRRLLLGSLIALALCGCGARINSAATNGQSTTRTYPITITGTTTNLDGSVLQHTATVTLTVQ